KHREDARRIAPPRRRLSCGEAHLALRASEAGDGVDEQHHAASLIAEVLGIRRRDLRCAKALERGDVARRDDDDAAPPALLAEGVLQELADLSPALTDEPDDDDVRCGAAR